MAYMALYRKWRPRTFDDVVGQEAVVTALRNQILYQRIGHAYLFCGTRGTGKTSMAKIFARAVNCLHPVNGNPCNECELCTQAESGFNLVEIDAASHTGVENIREIRDEVQYTPAQGKYRVYIIDEVHMLSSGAFNALLKTLEEPPEHVIFILATTEPHKVLPTIVSRCQRYDFKRFSIGEILGQLQKLREAEGFPATDDALRYIAKAADGGMRDALSILEQCVSFYMQEEITLDKVLEVLGASGNQIYEDMSRKVSRKDTAGALEVLGDLFKEGRDADTFVSGWIGYLRSLLMVQALGERGSEILEIGEEEKAAMMQQSREITSAEITYFIEALSELESRMKYASEKRVLLEVEVIRLCHMETSSDVSALLARIDSLEQKLASGSFTVNAAAAVPKGPAAPRKQQAAGAPQQAAPKPQVRRPSAGTSAVFDQWGSVKKKIVTENRSLYILNMMELRQGEEADQMILWSRTEQYVKILKDHDGARLRQIEQVIQEMTGASVHLDARYDSGEQKPQERVNDLDDILPTIHGDIEWM